MTIDQIPYITPLARIEGKTKSDQDYAEGNISEAAEAIASLGLILLNSAAVSQS